MIALAHFSPTKAGVYLVTLFRCGLVGRAPAGGTSDKDVTCPAATGQALPGLWWGYVEQQANRPQALACALTDSPAGQAAWGPEK